MADDPRPDDDATRIYRPYGSPPPDPEEAADAPDSATPDPFAPTPDPFAPDPEPPAAPDPFAPLPAAADPFAPPGDAPPSPDPFAPAADPFAPEPAAPDPFAPADGPAPFAPSPSSEPDPFSPPPHAAPDPFAPAPGDPPPVGDPFAPPPSATDDPFAPAADADPFAPAPSAPPATDAPFAPATGPDPFGPPDPPAPDPYRAGPADPFAPAPAPGARQPAERPDPFAPAGPLAATDDPFADLQGPTPGGRPSFDSGIREVSHEHDALLLPSAFDAEKSLAGAFTPVFTLILQLRASAPSGDPAALRQRIETLLREAAARAREAGAADADVEEATVCVVAFLDEAILGADWPGREGWSAHPLQLAHYDRNDLGERVFDRLKRLLDEGAVRRDVLEVYYLCLALGFRGRYAIHGREVLRRLVTDLHRRLSGAAPPGPLAPRGHSREAPAEAEAGGVPTWALWAGAAALVLVLYLGLSLSLSAAAADAADALRALQP